MGLRQGTRKALFMVRLVLRVASRALPARKATAPAAEGPDPEALIEALQTGDLEALAAHGPGLARARDSLGNPWFFIALESGSLAAVTWFLSHGASPTLPDRAGRLPLEALIQRSALADDFDDHLGDCAAMAQALITAGADPKMRSLQGQRLWDLAQAAGLDLPS